MLGWWICLPLAACLPKISSIDVCFIFCSEAVIDHMLNVRGSEEEKEEEEED
jgi:hypothetical protein